MNTISCNPLQKCIILLLLLDCLVFCLPMGESNRLYETSNHYSYGENPESLTLKYNIDIMKSRRSLMSRLLEDVNSTHDDDKMMDFYQQLQELETLEPSVDISSRPSWFSHRNLGNDLFRELYHSFHQYVLTRIEVSKMLILIKLQMDAIQFANQLATAEILDFEHFFTFALEWFTSLMDIDNLNKSYETSLNSYMKAEMVSTLDSMVFPNDHGKGMAISSSKIGDTSKAPEIFGPPPQPILNELPSNQPILGESQPFPVSFSEQIPKDSDMAKVFVLSYQAATRLCNQLRFTYNDAQNPLNSIHQLEEIKRMQPMQLMPPIDSIPLEVTYDAYQGLFKAFHEFELTRIFFQQQITEIYKKMLFSKLVSAIQAQPFDTAIVSSFMKESMDVILNERNVKKYYETCLSRLSTAFPEQDPRLTSDMTLPSLYDVSTQMPNSNAETLEKNLELSLVTKYPDLVLGNDISENKTRNTPDLFYENDIVTERHHTSTGTSEKDLATETVNWLEMWPSGESLNGIHTTLDLFPSHPDLGEPSDLQNIHSSIDANGDSQLNAHLFDFYEKNTNAQEESKDRVQSEPRQPHIFLDIFWFS